MSTTVRPHVMCRKHMRVHVRVRMITRQQRAAMAARPFIHQLSTNKAIVVIYPVILSLPSLFLFVRTSLIAKLPPFEQSILADVPATL